MLGAVCHLSFFIDDIDGYGSDIGNDKFENGTDMIWIICKMSNGQYSDTLCL